jgi:hypothetical protein
VVEGTISDAATGTGAAAPAPTPAVAIESAANADGSFSCTVLVFETKNCAQGCHWFACLLASSSCMHATNGIPLWCPLLLPMDTVKFRPHTEGTQCNAVYTGVEAKRNLKAHVRKNHASVVGGKEGEAANGAASAAVQGGGASARGRGSGSNARGSKRKDGGGEEEVETLPPPSHVSITSASVELSSADGPSVEIQLALRCVALPTLQTLPPPPLPPSLSPPPSPPLPRTLTLTPTRNPHCSTIPNLYP